VRRFDSGTVGNGVMHRLVTVEQAGSYRVETWDTDSQALRCTKRASVLVPTDIAVPINLPVLYLLHGFGGSRETWLRQTNLLAHLDGSGLLVVLPESGRRWFINDHRGLRYEDYLLGELLPFVEDAYAGAVAAGLRAIGGFSMGGAAALMHALRTPGMFRLVLSHAGAFEAPLRDGDPYTAYRGARALAIPSLEAHERVWGPVGSAVRRRYELYSLVAELSGGPRPVVYADIGTEDFPRMIEMNNRMVRALRQAGITTEFCERQGGHDLAYLDQALPFSLGFAVRQLRMPGPSRSSHE
jgi:putative tributyrin esterase